MSILSWKHFFKPEVRTSGQTLFAQGKVSVAQPSDIEMVAYIRIASPLKVSLKMNSMSSNTLFADCNCPVGKKNLFCKHIWAALLATEQKNPDFFHEKTDLEKMLSTRTAKTGNESYKEQQKEKQSLHRKIQYQKQKLRMNELKNKKNSQKKADLPSEVEKALKFFSENGFEFKEAMRKEAVATAKKKLARVFHPDHGGTHEEILILNNFSEILTKYIKS